jgi:hypothetical protein
VAMAGRTGLDTRHWLRDDPTTDHGVSTLHLVRR